MEIYHTKVDENGRIVLPAKLRKHVNLSSGDGVVIKVENGKVGLTPLKEQLEEVKRIAKKYIQEGEPSAVDMLFAMRKAERDRENG